MECRIPESPLTSGQAFPPPPPPPLPAHFYPRFHQITGRRIKGCCTPSNAANISLDRLFDEGYRADISILTEGGGVIYAHSNILGNASPVFKGMLKKLKCRGKNKLRSITIRGVSPEAVCVFIRFLYSSCYEEEDVNEFALSLLVLSHAYVVPQLKRLTECWLEQRFINTENVVDIFQFALLCDAPRLSLICHRFVMLNLKAVSASEGWTDMKVSHPVLEKEILHSIMVENALMKDRTRKRNERKVYVLLYEAMEALVHICNDGCQTIGPHDKILRRNQSPCKYEACKGLEALIRHFTGCKLRGPGGCIHCKRMWQILDFHSRLCANTESCRVPLCSNFRQRRRKQSKKEDMRWRILVKKTVRSKSITGAPFFSLETI